MNEIIVSHHALKRFKERALGGEVDGLMTRVQMTFINDLILESLKLEHPEAFQLGSGEYKLHDYNVTISIKGFKVLTIKDIEKSSSKLSGGILKSGGKVKKLNGNKYEKQRHIDQKEREIIFSQIKEDE